MDGNDQIEGSREIQTKFGRLSHLTVLMIYFYARYKTIAMEA